jgi:ribonucleotide monophosphatase NagD (HAD superfamily)
VCVVMPGRWVVGDAPNTDIGGGRDEGLQAILLAHGQPWLGTECRPK